MKRSARSARASGRDASVCFVTCLRWPDVSASDDVARRALEARGVAVSAHPWDGPFDVFERFDAVILRSNWDYHRDPDRFVAWLDALDRRTTVWNPPALVRWNVAKRYLLDLARAGVPIIPTAILTVATPDAVVGVMEERAWAPAVVKPLVSASAHGTALVAEATVAAATVALAEGSHGRPVIVQPLVEEIRSRGEWSLVFVEGHFTHAVLKRPAAGEFRVQSRLGGQVEVRPVPATVLEAARSAIAALPCPALYARVDGVETASGFQVMEVEVNEPGLFFTHAPAAAERLAAAIARRLMR